MKPFYGKQEPISAGLKQVEDYLGQVFKEKPSHVLFSRWATASISFLGHDVKLWSPGDGNRLRTLTSHQGAQGQFLTSLS